MHLKLIDYLEILFIRHAKKAIIFSCCLMAFIVVLMTISLFVDYTLLKYITLAAATLTIIYSLLSIFLYRRFLKRTNT